ncbi:MAG TPA: cytochrome c oxidase subunit II [Usitatibacter sp.]|nr:cytochrome c oxidase subunit II [Usitatibacter sp.]
MSERAGWILPAASDAAQRVDRIFFVLLAVTSAVAIAIAIVVVVFCIRYRRSAVVDRSNAPVGKRWLEYAWTATPMAIFLGFFAWGAVVYAGFYGHADGAMPIFVVGKQWMWRVEHPGGRREIDELHVPLGQKVRLVFATEDVIHSFYVPAFRMKQDAVPGRYTEVTLTPTRLGTYEMHCTEYCGTDHARMGGRVIVMRPEDFARWLAEGGGGATMAARGFEAFRRLGCSGCHDPRSTVHAPDLAGLYGRTVHLQDGRTVLADEAYIRDSILLPKRDVVAGFDPVMPSFQGQASEEDILDLIAYLKSTGGERP